LDWGFFLEIKIVSRFSNKKLIYSQQNHEIAEVAWQINHEPKRRFIPSKWCLRKTRHILFRATHFSFHREAKLVLRIVRALRAHATTNALQSVRHAAFFSMLFSTASDSFYLQEYR
tara:strand:- start:501 stop:848 length:348 start_codon:yes stop_codon:yes gene_type:complete